MEQNIYPVTVHSIVLELISVIQNLLSAFDALDDCDCGGSELCPICRAHKILKKVDV